MRKHIAREKDLETPALLAAASVVLYLVFRKPVFLLLALGLLLLALFFRKAAARLAALWLAFSAALGAVNTKIVLGAVYFLLLTPLAFVFRLLHGGGAGSKADPAVPTYFIKKKHLFVPGDLENPW